MPEIVIKLHHKINQSLPPKEEQCENHKILSFRIHLHSQPQPVDLKGFYTSEKKPDKLVQEGIFTIFNEIDEMKNGLNAILRPNGSQQAPARTCYDLFLYRPNFDEGKLQLSSYHYHLACCHVVCIVRGIYIFSLGGGSRALPLQSIS